MEFFNRKLGTSVYKNFENIDFLTNPKIDDYKLLLRILEKSFYIRDCNTLEPIPCFSSVHSEGLACPVFSDREDCSARCNEFEHAYEADLEVVQIRGTWSFFNLCAFNGCVGVVLDDQFPVRFFNRLSDMDRGMPSIAYIRILDIENSLDGIFFGKRGSLSLETGRTIKWNNYEKSDKLCVKYLLFGDPLPGNQLRAHTIFWQKNTSILIQDDYTFLGPYISFDGAIPIFSDEKIAQVFAKSNNFIDTEISETEVQLKDDYRISPIKLFEYLNNNASKIPFSDIVLNPSYHRAFQGWFFKFNSRWVLQTISGFWDIECKIPVKITEIQVPKRYLGSSDNSILSLSGVSTTIQFPLKRLTGSDLSPFSVEDAEDVIDTEMDLFHEPILISEGSVPPTDSFCLDAFDKVSGERYAISNYDPSCVDFGFLVFPDFVSLIAYLSNTILEIDENARLNGYQLCNGSGQAGSKNEIHEKNISKDIRLAFKKILTDALVNGYSLKHSNLVKKLMKDASATCEIVECGYFGDFIFYDLSDGNELESRLDNDPDFNQERNKISKIRSKLQIKTQIPEEYKMHLRSILSETFDKLTPDTILIAATALEEFSIVGKRVGYDYAGISMKVAKIFERELTIRVFRKWRAEMLNSLGKNAIKSMIEVNADEAPGVDQLLSDYFNKKKKTDLGGMRYIFKMMSEEMSENTIASNFKNFILTFPDPDWLLSGDFLSVLNDISSKYRNGGVHEHVVSFEVCDEAIKRILLDESAVLKRLVLSTEQ